MAKVTNLPFFQSHQNRLTFYHFYLFFLGRWVYLAISTYCFYFLKIPVGFCVNQEIGLFWRRPDFQPEFWILTINHSWTCHNIQNVLVYLSFTSLCHIAFDSLIYGKTKIIQKIWANGRFAATLQRYNLEIFLDPELLIPNIIGL